MRLTDELPGTGGALKTVPDDFIVEEIPAYPPSGEGYHLFLTVEKRGISTQEMLRRIARALDLPTTALGAAGQKDQQAVTRQVVSVPLGDIDPVRAANLVLEDERGNGARVLSAARHRHKLRTGHLRGNRFLITLRGVHPDAEARARAILDRLAASWLPNYFGEQRFGRGAENLARGRALLRGELRERDRFKRRFLLSAYQAALYNHFLALRMTEGTLHRVISGEVLQVVGSSGLFRCEEHELVANQARLEQRQIVPTGPMFGSALFQPTPDSPAAEREQHVLDEEGLTLSAFAPFGKLAEGTRRPLLVRIEAPSIEAATLDDGPALRLSFTLPSGSYATVLLDEIMKRDEA